MTDTSKAEQLLEQIELLAIDYGESWVKGRTNPRPKLRKLLALVSEYGDERATLGLVDIHDIDR